MKKIFFFLTVLFFFGCNDTGYKPLEKEVTQKDKDSLTSLSSAINNIRKEEKIFLDSVRKYSLDSINERCKNLLYVLYSKDTLVGSRRNETVTIGECNIVLFGFENKSANLKELHYDILVHDSIPMNWLYNTQPNEFKMVHSFEIDVKTKKIIKALISEHASMQITDIEKAFDSIKISSGFKNYLSNYKCRLHPNFKIL